MESVVSLFQSMFPDQGSQWVGPAALALGLLAAVIIGISQYRLLAGLLRRRAMRLAFGDFDDAFPFVEHGVTQRAVDGRQAFVQKDFKRVFGFDLQLTIAASAEPDESSMFGPLRREELQQLVASQEAYRKGLLLEESNERPPHLPTLARRTLEAAEAAGQWCRRRSEVLSNSVAWQLGGRALDAAIAADQAYAKQLRDDLNQPDQQIEPSFGAIHVEKRAAWAPLRPFFRNTSPYCIVVETNYPETFRRAFASEDARDWLGAAVTFREPAKLVEQKLCNAVQRPADRSGRIGGRVRFEWNDLGASDPINAGEFHLAADHSISNKCASRVFKNSVQGNEPAAHVFGKDGVRLAPDIALLGLGNSRCSSNGCFAEIQGLLARPVQLISQAAIDRTPPEAVSLRLAHHAPAQAMLGVRETTYASYRVYDQGVTVHFPCVRIVARAGPTWSLTSQHRSQGHFSLPGDSGAFVTDEVGDIFYGLIVVGPKKGDTPGMASTAILGDAIAAYLLKIALAANAKLVPLAVPPSASSELKIQFLSFQR